MEDKKEMNDKVKINVNKPILIAVALLFIFIFILNSQPAMAATISACGTLGSANTVYNLTNDITSSATCLTVGANNITIDCKGFRIDCSQTDTGSCVLSNGFNSITVKNCSMYTKINGDAVRYITSSKGRIIDNIIRTKGNTVHGIYLSTGSNSNMISNNDMNISSNNGYAIFIVGSTNNTLTFNKANSSNANSYILQGTASSDYKNFIGSSNLAEGRPVNYTYNKSSLVFNNVDFTKYGQVMFAWSRNITITRSNFSRDSLNLFAISNSTIYKNRITTNTGYGMWVYYSSSNRIANNTIINSNPSLDGQGIYIYGLSKSNSISNNTIKASGYNGYGIELNSGSNNNISKNNITTSGLYGFGIYLVISDKNNVVDNLVMTSGSTAYGIRVSGGASKNNKVMNNTVITSNTGSHGIYLEGCSNNVFTDNEVYSSSSLCYFLLGTVINNSIDSSNFAEGRPVNYTYNKSSLIFNNVNFTKYGQVIFSYGRNITITSSNFSKDSLTFFKTNDSSVSYCRINTSTSYGIMSYSSSKNTFDHNIIRTSGSIGHGIYLYDRSDRNNVTSNMIMTKGSGSNGINLYSYSYGNQLRDNIINATTGTGIFLDDYHTDGMIDNNTITVLTNGNGMHLDAKSDRNKIRNNTISILASTAISSATFIYDSSNNIFTGNSIRSLAGIGLYLSTGANNNIIGDDVISTSAQSGWGIYIFRGTDNNTFSDMHVTTKGSNANALRVLTLINSFTMSDSILNSSYSGLPEMFIESTSTGGTWNFTNVTRSNGKPIKKTWGSTGSTIANGRLNMHWYLDVRVKNSTSPLQGANVTSYNNLDVRAFSALTSSQGNIRKALIEYSTIGPNSTNYTWSSPYNLSISLAGYPIYYNSSINLSNNRFLDINLACFCPIGQGWVVRDYCHMSNSICNMPDYKVTCLSSGRIIMNSYTIIAKKAITPINHGCLLMDNKSKLLIAS